MTDCPRHDHGRNWIAENRTVTAACGCVVHETTVRQVTGRPLPKHLREEPAEPAPTPDARCDAPRTPNGVVRCYHTHGHPGPHSWEKPT